jgi:DNA-binding NarL/FixJ family response regulator
MADKADKKIRVVIADDHAIFRDGLRMLLAAEPGIEVVGEASDGTEVLSAVRRAKPHILLLDLAMPRLPGIESLRQLAEAGEPVRTILLTAAAEREQVVEALQLGARGVVLKESATQVLLKSIRCVMEGQYWVGRGSVTDLVEALRSAAASPTAERPEKAFGITARELEIIGAVTAGLSNKDIAAKFQITEDTVKHHLTNIYDKLGVSNRLELALFAIHHSLVAKL